jgi:hypothetical protein
LILKDSGGKILDQQTIPVLRNGENGKDAITLVLDNENDTFIEKTEATKTIKATLYKGVNSISTGVIIEAATSVGSNITASVAKNADPNNAYTITLEATNEITAGGSITITAKYENQKYTKQFTYNVIVQGSNGINAVYYEL